MLGSKALEVAIGLVLVFLLVSLILTAVRETVEAFFKSRAVDLERAIAELLNDRDGSEDGIRTKFYKHPLIAGLYSGTYEPTKFYEKTGKPVVATGRLGFLDLLSWVLPVRVKGSKRKPTYIPRRQFALTLLDLARSGQLGGAAAKAILTFRPSTDGQVIADNWNRMGDQGAQEELKTLTANVVRDTTGKDFDDLRAAIEGWYDGAMNRASGWYRRRTQVILFVLGLFVAVALNINAVTIGRALATDDTLRAAMVSLAEKTAEEADFPFPSENSIDPAADGSATTETAADIAAEAGTVSHDIPAQAATDLTGTGGEAEDGEAAPAEDSATAEAVVPEEIDESGARSAVAIDSEASTNKNDKATSGNEVDALDAWAQTRQLHREFLDLSLPIGWGEATRTATPRFTTWLDWHNWLHWLLWVSGFLVAAFAATLGAPFWFDVLNKVIVIRSTVKPNEKSGDEGSEDRKTQSAAKIVP